jgi:hypothetical protein
VIDLRGRAAGAGVVLLGGELGCRGHAFVGVGAQLLLPWT